MVSLVGRLGLDDFLFGRRDEPNNLRGDAAAMDGSQRGGDDLLVGGRNGGRNDLRGDAAVMAENAVGGDDRVFGGDGAEFNFLTGDGEEMTGRTVGGDDFITGGDHAENRLHGDGVFVEGPLLRTGSDTLVGGDNADNALWGDGWEMGESLGTGHDLLIGGRNSINFLCGDGNWLGGRGGNDRLIGGARSDNELMGDARYLFSQGGNDTLFASNSGSNLLYGDAYQMLGTSIGGNDRLVSGRGDDDLWGDAKFRSGIYLGEASEEEWYENPPELDETTGGSDVFVFRPGNGDDTIHDFEQGKDVIEFRNFGLPWDSLDFDDLTIVNTAEGCVIALAGGNSVTVLGLEELTGDDFRFRSDLSWSNVLTG